VAPSADAAPFLDRIVEASRSYLKRNDREKWDDSGGAKCPAGGEGRPRTGAYGMWNWGDWNFPGYRDDTKGCDAWGNLEYDTAQVLALAYVTSGRAELFEARAAAARHFGDVDTIHAPPARPEWAGMNHPKNPLHFTFELGGVDLGHTWTEGLLTYAFLTGDDRALAAARGIADYLVRRSGRVFHGNPRQWGWPQVALVAVFEATGDERYRRAALEYARGGMGAYPANRPAGWKLGILADGLAYTHAVTGDGEIEKWLRTYAAAVAATGQPEPRLCPAVAYVASISSDDRLRSFAGACADRVELGGWGKPFTIGGRIAFRTRSLLARRGDPEGRRAGAGGALRAPTASSPR
jgi:hypothetical protein